MQGKKLFFFLEVSTERVNLIVSVVYEQFGYTRELFDSCVMSKRPERFIYFALNITTRVFCMLQSADRSSPPYKFKLV